MADIDLVERDGERLLVGPAGAAWLDGTSDGIELVEACFDNQADRLLLYAENLTPRFFDLSSRQAGEILQKLRNYQIRLAVVLSPEARALNPRFAELMIEENRDRHFRLFDDRAAAEAWLLDG